MFYIFEKLVQIQVYYQLDTGLHAAHRALHFVPT